MFKKKKELPLPPRRRQDPGRFRTGSGGEEAPRPAPPASHEPPKLKKSDVEARIKQAEKELEKLSKKSGAMADMEAQVVKRDIKFYKQKLKDAE